MQEVEGEQVTERMNALQDERSLIQQKAFTKWINSHLNKAEMKVDNIFTDLQDGNKLLKLLEILSGDKVATKPIRGGMRQRFFKIENVNKALEFLRTKIRLESIGPEDIVDGNQVLILGLIWTIILRFQIQNIEVHDDYNNNFVADEETEILSAKEAKEALLQWCQTSTEGYPHVKIQNFSSSWRNGMAFNAIIHAHRPTLFDFNELQPENHIYNLNHAFDAAEIIGVSKLLDAEDVDQDKPDDLSILTYLITIHDTITKKINNSVKEESHNNTDEEQNEELSKNGNEPEKGSSKDREVHGKMMKNVNSSPTKDEEYERPISEKSNEDKNECIIANNSANQLEQDDHDINIAEEVDEEFEIIYGAINTTEKMQNSNDASNLSSDVEQGDENNSLTKSEEDFEQFYNEVCSSNEKDLENVETVDVSDEDFCETVITSSNENLEGFHDSDANDDVGNGNSKLVAQDEFCDPVINSNYSPENSDKDIDAEANHVTTIIQNLDNENLDNENQPITSDSIFLLSTAESKVDVEDEVRDAGCEKLSKECQEDVKNPVEFTHESEALTPESQATVNVAESDKNTVFNTTHEINNNEMGDIKEKEITQDTITEPANNLSKIRSHIQEHGKIALWLTAGILIVYAGHKLLKKGTL